MKKVLFVALLFVASLALATTTAGPLYSLTFNGVTYTGPTASNVCQQWGAVLDPYYGGGASATGEGSDTFFCTSWANDYHYNGRIIANAYCPPDTTLSNGQCSDPPPPPPTCTAGQKGTTVFDMGPANVQPSRYPTALDGCVISVENLVECHSNASDAGKPDREIYCTLDYVFTGAVASGGDGGGGASDVPSGSTKTPDVSPPTSSGSGGSCPTGTVNIGTDSSGIPICQGSGSSPGTPTQTTTQLPPTTTTNADGSTTTTNVQQVQNTDGSTTTTTTTTTTGTNGQVTKTVDVTTSDNAAGGAGQADGDPNKNDLCTLHPELNACKNSSVSGSCGAISCNGDAIQCAILREQAKRNCDDKADSDATQASPEYGLGDNVMNGNDPLGSTLPSATNGSVVTMPSSLDSSGWLSGGACFPDKQFTVQGHTLTLPFSSACDELLAFRYVVMIVALLTSFRMLSGVIFRE